MLTVSQGKSCKIELQFQGSDSQDLEKVLQTHCSPILPEISLIIYTEETAKKPAKKIQERKQKDKVVNQR